MFYKLHSFAAIGFLASVLGSFNHAQANDVVPPQWPHVGPLQYQGNGCPAGTVQSGLADNGNYEMIFDAFEAVTSPSVVQASTNCTFRASAQLAPGWKLQIGAVFIDGTQKIATHGSGRIDTSYRIGNNPSFRWGTDLYSTEGQVQNLNIQAEPNDAGEPENSLESGSKNWSSCGGKAEISGDLHVLAHRGAGLQDASEVILHNKVIGGVSGGAPGNAPEQNALRWDWRYAPCLSGKWNSQYVTASGEQIQAFIIANGTQGEYHVASAGRTFVGKLSNLHSNGNFVQGQWSMGNSRGWLSFAPNAEGHFDGSWGLGEQGSPALGSWNGDSVDR